LDSFCHLFGTSFPTLDCGHHQFPYIIMINCTKIIFFFLNLPSSFLKNVMLNEQLFCFDLMLNTVEMSYFFLASFSHLFFICHYLLKLRRPINPQFNRVQLIWQNISQWGWSPNLDSPLNKTILTLFFIYLPHYCGPSSEAE